MAVSAQFYVSVDSGPNQTGGVDVAAGAAITFVPASTVGWLRARWEIYDYPEEWTAPAGWSTASDGTIFYVGLGAPPSFVIPAPEAAWGTFMVRLLVNEQIDVGGDVAVGDGSLLYDNIALCLVSPSGLRSIGAREAQHFTTATTRVKGWARTLQRMLKLIESPGVTVSTSNTTPARIRRVPVPDGQTRVLRAIVKCWNADATKYGEYEVKAHYRRSSGTLSTVYAGVTTVIESDIGLNVTVTMNGNTDVDINVVGLNEQFLWKFSDLAL